MSKLINYVQLPISTLFKTREFQLALRKGLCCVGGGGGTTYLMEGTNVTITGTGTQEDPYIISASGGSGISGLTAGYLSKSATGTTINDSAFLQVGSNILLGSTSDTGEKFQVTGISKFNGNVKFEGGGSTVTSIYADGSSNLNLALNGFNRMTLYPNGDVKVLNLSGTGTRMVVADLDGILSTQTIPSGGGGAISDLTAATAANTINNVANEQHWQWDSLTTGKGLTLSSASTSISSGRSLFNAEVTGTISAVQTTYASKISNNIVNPLGTQIALYLEAINVGAGTGSNYALYTNGDVFITSDTKLMFGSSAFIRRSTSGGGLEITAPTGGGLDFYPQTANGIRYFSSVGVVYMSLPTISSTSQAFVFGGDYVGSYRAEGTSAAVIERAADVLSFSANSGTGGGYAGFTPNKLLSLRGSTSNVGINTITPDVSSLLDMVSTTKGFLPPRMTTTQINAISSPAEGLTVYNTTLHTICFFDGTIWQKVTSSAM